MDLNSLSSASLTVMNRAAQEMYGLKTSYLGVEHLFLGLLIEPCPRVEQVCESAELDKVRLISTLKAWLRRQAMSPLRNQDEVLFTPRLQRVHASAGLLCARLGAGPVEPLHLLYSCLAESRSIPSRLLDSLSAHDSPSAKALLAEIEIRLGYGGLAAEKPEAARLEETHNWGHDLTAMAESGRLSEAPGRQEDVLAIAEILSRQHRNQVLLLAESGVGTTKLVEALALLLNSDLAPKVLKGLRLCRLEPAAMFGDAASHSEIEARLEGLLNAASPGGDAILVLENLPELMTSAGPSAVLADLLRPALARPGLRVIATATPKGISQAQTTEPHLAKRFEVLAIEELSETDTKEVLLSLRPSLEEFHGVTISPNALDEAIRLSVRYLGDRRLPGKAIDVLDQACASLLLTGLAAGEAHLADTHSPGAQPIVEVNDVSRVVSRLAGVPLERVGKEEAQQLLHLEEALQTRLFGQNEAVGAISAAVRAGRAGVSDARRPIATVMFAGPTGVGKTELAKALAAELFGSEDSLVRIDMTEYSESHSVARLTGAPPGYIGFGQDGVLVSALRKRPYSVVLFDELEKAHADIYDLLLPVLDEGRLESTSGAAVDMRHAVLVMTTNLFSEAETPLGFGSTHQARHELDLRAQLAKHFRPEFINRLDAIIPFRALEKEDLRAILQKHLRALVGRVAEQGAHLTIDSAVEELILSVGTDLRFGARPLERAVDQLLRQPLAEALLRDEALQTGRLRAALKGERVLFRAD